MTSPADLPDDIDALKATILASQAKMTEQDGVIERKKDRIVRLEKLLADFMWALCGAKSEKGHLLHGSRLHANDERADQYHPRWKTLRRPWQLSMPRTKRLICQRQRARQSHLKGAACCPSTCHASKKLLHLRR
jgi:hypothetical protein